MRPTTWPGLEEVAEAETATAAAGAARTVTQAEPHAQAGGAAREGRRRTAHAPPHGQQEPPQGKRAGRERAGAQRPRSRKQASPPHFPRRYVRRSRRHKVQLTHCPSPGVDGGREGSEGIGDCERECEREHERERERERESEQDGGVDSLSSTSPYSSCSKSSSSSSSSVRHSSSESSARAFCAALARRGRFAAALEVARAGDAELEALESPLRGIVLASPLRGGADSRGRRSRESTPSWWPLSRRAHLNASFWSMRVLSAVCRDSKFTMGAESHVRMGPIPSVASEAEVA